LSENPDDAQKSRPGYRGGPKESGVEGVTGAAKAAPVGEVAGGAGGIGGIGGKLGPATAPSGNDGLPGCGAATPP